MFERFFKSSFWPQAVMVAFLAFTLHVFMHGIGLNIVMRDYCMGGQAFLNGADPYEATKPLGQSNSFKYSPLFALISGGIAQALPPEAVDPQVSVNTQGTWVFMQASGRPPVFFAALLPNFAIGLWVLASTVLFAFGLRRWCDLAVPAPFYVLFAFAAAMLDLAISTGVYQINAIAIGLLLIGIAEYREGRYISAGALLVIAANLKIYPVLFLFALLLHFKWRFWLGALCGGLVALLLPALFVGWTHNINTHIAWVKVVMEVSGSYRILDIVSSFERVGLAAMGVVLNKVVFVASLVVFYACALVGKRAGRMDWRPWIAFGMAAMILVSPKTEVYTYVMLAPAYLFLFYWCRESKLSFMKKFGAAIATILAVACASCRFVDPTWYHSESSTEIIRVLSALGFWILSGGVLVREMITSWRARKTAGA